MWWKWLIRKEKSEEWTETDRKDWALAQLTYEVYLLRMTVVGMFSKVTIDRTLVDFLPSSARAKVSPPAPKRLSLAEATAASKSKWFAAVGYTPAESKGITP